MSLITPKCHFCYECNGTGCISELPGMGGIRKNINFQLNCSDWNLYPRCSIADEELEKCPKPKIRLAPITGGTENIGFADETQYYYAMIEACAGINLPLCIGDGCPDIKLKSGIDAVSKESKKADLVLIATGSEVSLAIDAQKKLLEKKIDVRVVSMPSWELFEAQDEKYQEEVLLLPRKKRVSVEMLSTFGWDRWAKYHMGIDTFGASAPAKDVFKKFNFTSDRLVEICEGALK